MTRDKLSTLFTLIGLTVMTILLVVFNDSPLWINAIIGGGTALLSWGIGRVVFDNVDTTDTSDSDYPVVLYITGPYFLFSIQFISELNRTGTITFDTVAYALGLVGMYYIIVHVYEYFIEDLLNKKVSKTVQTYLGWAIVIVFLAILLGLSYWL